MGHFASVFGSCLMVTVTEMTEDWGRDGRRTGEKIDYPTPPGVRV